MSKTSRFSCIDWRDQVSACSDFSGPYQGLLSSLIVAEGRLFEPICNRIFDEALGFEPRMTEPKSVVLPLHHASIKHQPSCLAGESITPFCSSESNPYTIYYRGLRYPLSVKSFLFLLFLFVINSLIFFLHTAFTFSINNCMSTIIC